MTTKGNVRQQPPTKVPKYHDMAFILWTATKRAEINCNKDQHNLCAKQNKKQSKTMQSNIMKRAFHMLPEISTAFVS